MGSKNSGNLIIKNKQKHTKEGIIKNSSKIIDGISLHVISKSFSVVILKYLNSKVNYYIKRYREQKDREREQPKVYPELILNIFFNKLFRFKFRYIVYITFLHTFTTEASIFISTRS